MSNKKKEKKADDGAQAQTLPTTKENRVHRILPVPLTDEEIRLAGKNLAATFSDIRKVQSRRSMAMAGFKKEMEELQDQQREFENLISTGIEEKQVECIEVYYFETGMVIVTRLDDGQKVTERKMSDLEKQMRGTTRQRSGPADSTQRTPMKTKSDITVIIPAGTPVAKTEDGKFVPSLAMADACPSIDADNVELEAGDEGYTAPGESAE